MSVQALTGTAASAVSSPAELLRVADLGPVALELPRALEVLERLVALAELGEGRTEVVLRVRLVRTAGTGERCDRQTGDLLGVRGIAATQECGCLVGQGGAAWESAEAVVAEAAAEEEEVVAAEAVRRSCERSWSGPLAADRRRR